MMAHGIQNLMTFIVIDFKRDRDNNAKEPNNFLDFWRYEND
jgi:hypothetical protein